MKGGQAILQAVERGGVDYIFSSPGSEWPPLWEALAGAARGGAERPRYVNCRHEGVAVSMAAGYTKVTRRPQLVVLHATAGPLNAAMNLRAALQERTPMVILNGEVAAYGENRKVADPGGQWLHDLSDLGGGPDLLRGCVKWADRISAVELLAPTVERALRIAVEPPAGPVLIGVPFECMMQEVEFAGQGKANETARPREVADEAVERALALIAAARNPLALTEYAGADPRAVQHLIELCERFAIPVMEPYRPSYMNFPRTHPLYLHHDPAAVDQTDLALIVDAVMPWHPASRAPRNARVVCICEEFPHSRLAYWGYDVDLALVAPPAATLEKLVKRAGAVGPDDTERERRLAQARERHDAHFARLKKEALAHAGEVPIDPRWACHALGEAIPQAAIVCEETTTHRTLIQEAVRGARPQSYFARITGGLGVVMGYALGVKLAQRERPVFLLVGDGAFHYNAVPACLGVAQEYGLPIHVVVFNNGGYRSMEGALLRYFPDGAARRTGIHPGAAIEPRPDYRNFASAYGGYGCRVTGPGEIGAAVAQALAHEAQGRLSVIDLVLSELAPH